MRLTELPVRAALTLAAAAALAAGCSGSSPSSKVSATPTTATLTTAAPTSGGAPAAAASSGGGPSAGLTDFLACMRDNGVSVPAQASGGGAQPPNLGGVDQAKLADAQKACQAKLPAGASPAAGSSSAFAAYRSCMADHGVTLPTPAAGATPQTPPSSIDQSGGSVSAAQQACRGLLPTNPATPGAGSGAESTTPTSS